MKVFNKGKASIKFGENKGDVLPPQSTRELPDATGAYLVKLYPHMIVDVANIGVEHLMDKPAPVDSEPADGVDAEKSDDDLDDKRFFKGKKKAAE